MAKQLRIRPLNATRRSPEVLLFITLLITANNVNESNHNKCMKWIRQPVPALADATSEPEQFTTYARGYVSQYSLHSIEGYLTQ